MHDVDGTLALSTVLAIGMAIRYWGLARRRQQRIARQREMIYRAYEERDAAKLALEHALLREGQ